MLRSVRCARALAGWAALQTITFAGRPQRALIWHGDNSQNSSMQNFAYIKSADFIGWACVLRSRELCKYLLHTNNVYYA
jgi:hypothetical protein